MWIATMLLLGAFLQEDFYTLPVNQQKIVLEVKWEKVGLDGSEGEHLYARIYDDGRIEFEDRIIVGLSPKQKVAHVTKQSKLSRLLLKNIIGAAKSYDKERWADDYDPPLSAIDSFVLVEVTIFRQQDTKTIKLTNFDPSVANARKFYPSGLLRLLCLIEKSRKGAVYSVSRGSQKDCPN